MSIKKTHQMFVDEIHELYGDEYEILSEYKYAKEKIQIRHNCSDGEYREFSAAPTNLLTGHTKCPRCSKKKKYTHNDMKRLFEERDCQLITKEYHDVFDKIEFICNKHPEEGIQVSTYHKMIYTGNCCNKCGRESGAQKQLDNITIEQLRDDFSNKGLVLLEDHYKGAKAKYKCSCVVHKDTIMEITYDNLKHKKSLGCTLCHNISYSEQKRTPENILRLKVEELGLIFDHVEYTGRNNNGTLIYYKCPHHLEYGIQVKKINKLNIGQGCPYCNQSHGERQIEKYLNNHHINFIPQKSFNNLVGVGGLPLTYDFYLNDYNILIEYQGIQHERPVELFQRHKDQFSVQKEHDSRKKQYADSHNYRLLEIWYYDYDNIEIILDNTLTKWGCFFIE